MSVLISNRTIYYSFIVTAVIAVASTFEVKFFHCIFKQVHSELRKWLHNNAGAEVAASTRIIYGGTSLLFGLLYHMCHHGFNFFAYKIYEVMG